MAYSTVAEIKQQVRVLEVTVTDEPVTHVNWLGADTLRHANVSDIQAVSSTQGLGTASPTYTEGTDYAQLADTIDWTTIGTAPEWVNGTSYVLGNQVRISGEQRYRCLLAHTAETATNKPGSGSSWQTYWMKNAPAQGASSYATYLYGPLTTAEITKAVTIADSIIDGFATTLYSLPFAATPPLVNTLSIDIASFYSYKMAQIEIPERAYADYRRALDLLGEIARGVVQLVDANGVNLRDSMIESTTEDYTRIFNVDDILRQVVPIDRETAVQNERLVY